MTFPVPESLKKYYEERAVFNAVNALVGVLDGTNVPELSREEAKNYNQALLMAAQVRADFVDLLFRIWDEVFVKAKIVREESFDNSHNIWYEGYLAISHYYDSGENGDRSDTLGVASGPTDGDTHTIYLYIERWDTNDHLAARPDCVPSGLEDWKIIADDNHWYFRNDPVDMVKFLEDPDPTLDRFRHEATKMAEFLANAPA